MRDSRLIRVTISAVHLPWRRISLKNRPRSTFTDYTRKRQSTKEMAWSGIAIRLFFCNLALRWFYKIILDFSCSTGWIVRGRRSGSRFSEHVQWKRRGKLLSACYLCTFPPVTAFSTAIEGYQNPETVGTQGIPKDHGDCFVTGVTIPKLQKSKKRDAILQDYQRFSS